MSKFNGNDILDVVFLVAVVIVLQLLILPGEVRGNALRLAQYLIK